MVTEILRACGHKEAAVNDQSLLKSPGEMISEARVAQDLTIAQLSERTKIPPAILTALEMDEYHKVSGPLYIKSFLRTCAMDLGLDPQTVLNQYHRISGEQKSRPVGKEMVWKDEEVRIDRVGLPWIRIILGLGLVAVVTGLALFALRGCGGKESSSADSEPGRPVASELTEGSAITGSRDGEAPTESPSLMSDETEARLQQRAAVQEELRRLSESTAESSPPDTQALESQALSRAEFADPGPPPSSGEDPEITGDAGQESETVSVAWQSDGDQGLTPWAVPGQEASPDSLEDEETASDQDADEVIPSAGSSADESEQVARDEPDAGLGSREIASSEGSEEVVATDIQPPERPVSEETQTTPVPADLVQESGNESEDRSSAETEPETVNIEAVSQPEEAPTVDQAASAWPLVLRVACDEPQEILVKRDGDSQFSRVRWPDELSPAAAVPAAGFEAGRAYRDGTRLVVFWGAEDHFSLKLASVRGVQVFINGRLRDVSRLRPGQELILDAHSAGASAER
jgi:cytoskeletal protein RodZ